MSRRKDAGGDREDARLSKRDRARRELIRTGRDVIIAAASVVIVMVILYGYSGVWPPMVVIESSSMMHGDDSQIGVIDTGDLTLVKKVDDRSGIVTYVEAADPKDPNHGFSTYGDLGNVIIYQKNGQAGTPIIHRAIAWLEYNETASDPASGIYRGDLPDIGVYAVTEYTVKGLYTHPAGSERVPLTIHISEIFRSIARHSKPHDGFITKGDHNRIDPGSGKGADQEVLPTSTGYVEPVKLDWVVGRAEGELPWFGLLKLWISGQPTTTFPPSSSTGLVVTVALLIGVPFAADFLYARYRKRRKDRKTARGETREQRAEDREQKKEDREKKKEDKKERTGHTGQRMGDKGERAGRKKRGEEEE